MVTSTVRRRLSARSEWLVPAAVTAVAFGLRAWDLGHPDGFVWDEVYYGRDAEDALDSGVEMRAVHPPVGTKMIAVGVGLLGAEPVGRRLLPLLAGTAVVLLTYLLARRLLDSVAWAGLTALFVALDGLQIVHSRTAVLEIFLSVFVLGAVLAFLLHLDRQDSGSVAVNGWTLASGALVGLAIATKWVAAPFAVGMAVVTVLAAAPEHRRAAARVSAVSFVLLPIAVYVASYAVSWTSGDVSPLDWLDRQWEILRFHRELAEPHEFASPAIGWPLMIRPVPYFFATRPGETFEVLAVGNPALWLAFLGSLPALLVAWWRRRDRTVEVVLAAWVVLFVPWVLTLRAQIFFYYLTPLVPFMALGVVWCLRELWPRSRFGRATTYAVSGLVVLCAVVFLPIWLGLWISPEHLDRLLLFDSWRFPGT